MYVPSELRVIGKLAEDAVAASYAAHDLGGEPVLLVSGLVPADPAELERYTRWAEALASIARQQYVADVVTHGVAEQRAYLAVRTGRGRTLAERLATSGPLPYQEVRHLGACLADALTTAHAAGLCHLAVRPDVIYIDDERGPVLAGFDAAAPVLARPMAAGPLSAPEYHVPRAQLDGGIPMAGPAADVYALAASLCLALGGALPRSDQNAWLDPGRPAQLPELPGVPPELVEILRWALTVSPSHRPDARQLRDALRDPRPGGRAATVAGDDVPVELGYAGLSGLTIPMASPGEEHREPPPRQHPVTAEPATGEATADGIEPLTGMWRVVADTGEQELLVVDEQGAVTWAGSDETGPFVATGEALPLGDGVFRLLLNEPAGSVGFFVDLRLEGGGVSFLMDEPPEQGMVDVAAE